MKLKLRISPTLTRDQLIERLPAIIQTAAEAIIEKGRAVHGDIEKGLFRAHPVNAIAEHEGEFYHQGHDALVGIFSWLMRRLRIETGLKKSFTQENYRTEFQEKHSVELGSTVTLEQAKELDETLRLVPDAALQDRVRLISVDGKFGASKKRYPNHGRYYEEHERIVLNPNIFGEKTIYRDGKDEPVEKIQHTLLHEIGHSLDDDYGFSAKKDWRDISGWKFIGDEEPPKGCERLVLKEGKTTTLKGRWAYKKGTQFARWYGARNPKEDFCEAFAFAVLGAKQYFKGETGKKKLAFVEKIIDKLLKSDNPAIGLEASDDSEILKSDSFAAYYAARSSGLVHLDELEAVEIAKSEFIGEACEDVFYKANEGTQSPDIKLPKSTPPAVPSAGFNPLKGIMRPGHKYLYREAQPDGSFRYYYQMPSGHHYHSKEALHDDVRHQPQLKSPEEWAHYQQKVYATAPEAMAEVSGRSDWEAGGGKSEFFDPVEAPKLVEDIKPGPDDFKGEPQVEKEDEESGPEEGPEGDWRHRKPKREERDFQLTPEQEPKIEAALRTWEIEEVDQNFNKGGIMMKFRVKLKNDGWAILKPKAGSKKYAKDPVRGMDEMTTVYREAMAYQLDQALGWHLVPPTVIRNLKGVGNRLVEAAMKKEVGDDHYGIHEAFKKGQATEASVQFFVDDSEQFANAGSGGVSEEEKMRFVIFDMVLNHQDRHIYNLLISQDQDPDSRYSGGMRFVLIDNGYCAGYGEVVNETCYNQIKKETVGHFIDKKTLRSLRKLRSDIRNKQRRRKMFSPEVRANVTADQIDRIARRIDYLLSAKHRDNLGRVRLPSWKDLSHWEEDNVKLSDKLMKANRPDPAAEQFDVTGRTALLGKGQGEVPKFKSSQELQDFLSPILPYLNSRQKELVLEITTQFKAAGARQLIDLPFEKLISRMPKRLVNQLFVKQRLHERLGLRRHVNEFVERHIREHLDRDLLQDIKVQIRNHDMELYNKLERGEIQMKDARGLIPVHLWEKMEDRWLIPRNLRGIGKNVTERIFEDPEHFGWPQEPQAKRERALFQEPGEAEVPEVQKSQEEPSLIINIGD